MMRYSISLLDLWSLILGYHHCLWRGLYSTVCITITINSSLNNKSRKHLPISNARHTTFNYLQSVDPIIHITDKKLYKSKANKLERIFVIKWQLVVLLESILSEITINIFDLLVDILLLKRDVIGCHQSCNHETNDIIKLKAPTSHFVRVLSFE